MPLLTAIAARVAVKILASTLILALPSAGAATWPSTTAPLAGCFTPVCATPADGVAPQGGPVLERPVVYLVRFSTSRHELTPRSGFIPGAFGAQAPNAEGIAMATLNGSYAGLFPEYMLGGGRYQGGRYGASLTVFNPAMATARTLSDARIQTAVDAVASTTRIPTGAQPIFVVFTRTGQVVFDQGSNSATGFCAYHGSSFAAANRLVDYVVVPNETDQPGCDGVTGGSTSPVDQLGPTLSHELAETVTDPYPVPAWLDSGNGDEVVDLCANLPAYSTPVRYHGATYDLATLYSRVARACVGGPVPVMLYATPEGSSIVVTGYTAVGPLAGQPLVVANGRRVEIVRTNASGVATASGFDGAPATVRFAGNLPYAASSVTVGGGVIPSVLNASASAPSLEGGSLTGTATVSATLRVGGLPLAGHPLDLIADGTTLVGTAVTDAYGTAHFAVGAVIPVGVPLTVAFTGSSGIGASSANVVVPLPFRIAVSVPATTASTGLVPITVNVPSTLAGSSVYLETTQSAPYRATHNGVLTEGTVPADGTYSTLLAVENPGTTTYQAVVTVGDWRVLAQFTVTEG